MEPKLEVGMEAVREFEVEEPLLTDVGGTLGAHVLSTPGMIGMMERTAAMLVYPALGDGQATVGFEICVKHVAAVPRGSRCSVRAQLAEIVDGRKLRFDVAVTGPDGQTVGFGRHERRIIAAGEGGA